MNFFFPYQLACRVFPDFISYHLFIITVYKRETRGSEAVSQQTAEGIRATAVYFRPSLLVCPAPPMLTPKAGVTGEPFSVILLTASSVHFLTLPPAQTWEQFSAPPILSVVNSSLTYRLLIPSTHKPVCERWWRSLPRSPSVLNL